MAEGGSRNGHGRARGRGIGHVERDCAHALTVLRDEIVELFGLARRGHQAMAGSKHGLGEIATEAARASGDEPNPGDGTTPLRRVSVDTRTRISRSRLGIPMRLRVLRCTGKRSRSPDLLPGASLARVLQRLVHV